MAVTLTRGVDSTLRAELAKSVFNPIMLVYLDWPVTPIYVHTNVGDVSFASQTWSGVGAFGEVNLPQETLGLASADATLRLNGVNATLDGYLDDAIRGRTAQIWFGAVTTRAGSTLVGTPFSAFQGTMDSMRDLLASQNGDLMRSVQIGLTQGPSQRRVGEFYHTYEDQIRAYPGDTAGRFAIFAEAEASKLTWPA